MVSAIVGELLHKDPSRPEVLDDWVGVLWLHDDHYLMRTVVIGNMDVPVDLGSEPGHLFTACADCQHGHPWDSDVLGEFAIHPVESVHTGHELVDVDYAGSGYGDPFAAAVSSDHVRLDTQSPQQRKHRPVCGKNRFNGPLDLP